MKILWVSSHRKHFPAVGIEVIRNKSNIKLKKKNCCKNILEIPTFQGFILEKNLINYDV